MDFEKIGQYVVTESWENDTKGNPFAIITTVMPGFIVANENNIYFLDFKDNLAANQNYRGNCILFCGGTIPTLSSAMAERGTCLRNNYTAIRPLITSTSFWVSNGATIDIYKLKNWK